MLLKRLVVLLLAAGAAGAFSPAVTVENGVRLEIPAQAVFSAIDAPREVPVRLTNQGAAALTGSVRLTGVDSWRVEPARQTVTVAPGETKEVRFAVSMGPGTYRALYPLHAWFERAQATAPVHTVLVVSAEPPTTATTATAKVLKLTGPGVLPLYAARPDKVWVLPDKGAPYAAAGVGVDPRSKASYAPGGSATRGESRVVIGFHPPWAPGLVGAVAGDYRVELPSGQPARFTAGLAVRDSSPTEPLSDGVTFRVQVARADGVFRTVAEKHSAAKVWEPFEADLSAYAGQAVTLRLLGDPGPKRDTQCDSAYWGAPTIRVGRPLAAEPAERLAARASEAARLAAAFLAGAGRGTDRAFGWLVTNAAGRFGVAVVPGPLGLVDAQVAFAGAGGTVVFTGFVCQVAGLDLADALVGDQPVEVAWRDGQAVARHRFAYEGRSAVAQAAVRATGGGLQVSWTMPGVTRDRRGQPRYTQLALGSASVDTKRAYFGHGHVVVGAKRFSQGYGGFSDSTRFVGVDYANGVSLVTATDPFPDRFDHDQARRFTSLIAHHDATFTFVPSEQGAFAAARVWRQIANLPASPGVAAIRGKMCLDQWGGDYARAAADLRLATAYGLDEAVFVKHVWQRWGYDYRLPDIWPPAGDQAAYDDMSAAARLNGRLYAPHDNYIDFYPDATGYTYDHVVFTEDGQPHRAWYNKGRDALSYRWLPAAYWPFFEQNLKLMASGKVRPTSLFIDVFSAMAPFDGYNRAGEFFAKTVTQEWWGKTFDRVREAFGPSISEAGHDALIGHLDAAQADHVPLRGAEGVVATDRVPWFDMGHHGKFVLFAGGLGSRYAGTFTGGLSAEQLRLHSYGSDDYLSCTVLGGRTPMCDGPFSRRAVMTYWLLQPLCAELERQELLRHQFEGDTVTRQRVTFQNGAVVANRGEGDWTVDGQVLPQYGFVARAGDHQVAVTRRQGVISALATSPGLLFADARVRDEYRGSPVDIAAETKGFEDLGQRRFRLRMVWDVKVPVEATVRPFVHLCGPADMLPGWQPNADILFGAGCSLTPAQLTRAGRYEVTVEGTLPERLRAGRLFVRYGLYDPAKGGGRLPLQAPAADDTRYDGGVITITGDGAGTQMTWLAKGTEEEAGSRDNRSRKVVDFGPVATNVAFRLAHRGGTWTLTLLPGCRPGQVTLRLDQLGAKGRTVAGIEELAVDGTVRGQTTPSQQGSEVSFRTSDNVFAYRLTLR